MESLGGSMPAGRPVAVFAGGKTHVFAIAGGAMNHWTSPNGIDWSGPALLVSPKALEASYPCAIAIQNRIHLFAIAHADNLFASGGSLMHWFSADGITFSAPAWDGAWPIPGGANGIAASTPTGTQVDAFAVSANGIIRYSWSDALTSLGDSPLPDASNLPRCVPAAISSGPNVTDLFAVGADGSVLRWH